MDELINKLEYEDPFKISILLADDHPLFRQALKDTLSSQAGLQIIAETSDGEETVRVTKELRPDVVIMDISMPKLNGIEATRQIKKEYPNIAVLVLTVHDDSEHIFGILEAGAAGYLTKDVSGQIVANAIRSVISGESVLSPSAANLLIKQALRLKAKPVVIADGDKISIREMEVLRLAASGMSNKEIAQSLNLSLRTVRGYLSGIFSKLQVSSRTEAVIISLRAGILTLDDLG